MKRSVEGSSFVRRKTEICEFCPSWQQFAELGITPQILSGRICCHYVKQTLEGGWPILRQKIFSSTQRNVSHLGSIEKASPNHLDVSLFIKFHTTSFRIDTDTRLELRISWVCRPKTTFVSIDRINENLLNIRSK